MLGGGGSSRPEKGLKPEIEVDHASSIFQTSFCAKSFNGDDNKNKRVITF